MHGKPKTVLAGCRVYEIDIRVATRVYKTEVQIAALFITSYQPNKQYYPEDTMRRLAKSSHKNVLLFFLLMNR
jgi:hypothetical protein